MTTHHAEPIHDTVLQLRGIDAEVMAADCLDAASAFVRESPYWGKAELAMWLLGPYSRVVQSVGGPQTFAPTSLRQIELLAVENLLANAREEVLHAAERLDDPETADDVVFAMIASGFVAELVDAYGRTVWLPTPAARRLADRVLSLFVAARLTMRWTPLLAIAA